MTTNTEETLPFRFGLVAAQARSAQEWTALARRTEDLGYATLLVPDTVHTLASNVACAVAATATSTLRVGPYVLSAPNRSPGQVSIEAASLTTLTDARYELGVGAGRPGAEADAALFDRTYGSPRERIAAVRATIEAVRERSPATPILVAGSGPRMLTLAAELADTIAFGLPPEADEQALAAAVAVVHRAERALPTPVELSTNLLVVGDALPPWMPAGLDLPALVANGSIAVLGGSVQQMVDRLRDRRDRFGLSYVCTSASFADALAPVVEQLAGT
jgi:alkanesulfonate monooxygenase SsuD/methylene tetrahydromethanopterin reductase-like flavin-dependent oxidoreductase (luciferase family)